MKVTYKGGENNISEQNSKNHQIKISMSYTFSDLCR